MATTIGALRVELSANIARFEKDMGKAAKYLGRTQRSFERFGSRASAAGRSLSVGLTAPLVAVGALAAKSFLGFEQGMNRVAAVSGATEAEMVALTAIAKDLGATTSFSAAQAAEGLGFLAQAGFDATEAGRALPGVLQLAAAGGLQLAEAADIATNVLAGYGLEVDQLARVNDVLAKASSSANTDVLQLGQAFKFAGPVASSAGVSFETAGAAMALMGNAGIQAEMAGTALRGAITKLVNPSGEAAAAIAELEISVTDATGRLLPFDQIIEQLEPHADKTGAIMKIFGQRAGPAMSALISQGADALREMTTALEQSGGTAQEIADKKLAGLTGAWTKLKSATEGVLIEIGDRLRPVLERLAAVLTDRVLPAVRGALDAFGRLPPGMQTAAIVAVGLAAALGPALIALGGLVAVLTPLVPLFLALGKMTAVTTALAALRTALVAVGLAAPAAAAGVLGVGAAATGTTAAVNTTTLSLARLRVALLTQLQTFTRWGRAITGAAAAAGTAMSGLATGAGAKLAGAFGGLKVAAAGLGGALTMLGPAAAIVATGFASWKIGRWIGETTGLTDAVERLALRLQGFTDEEIRTVQESRKLLEETEKLRAAFDEFAEPLEALAAKDMAAWTNATKEAKDKARELADALPRTEIKVEHLSRAVREFAAEGKLTARVMREIGRQAQGLGLSLDELPPELRNIVTWFNRMAAAATEAGSPVTDLGDDLVGLSDKAKKAQDALEKQRREWTNTLEEMRFDEIARQRQFNEEQAKHELESRDAAGHAYLDKEREQYQAQQDASREHWETISAINNEIGLKLMQQDAAAMQGVWSRLGESFAGLGAQIGQTFARALEGGGQWLGAMQSLGVQAGDRLWTFLSKGLGARMTAGTGFLATGLGAVLGKAAGMAIPLIGPVIGSLVGKLFSIGGPSEAELAGRKVAKSFRDGVIQTLNEGQLAEAARAALGAWRGNEQGAQLLIGVRDAYLAVGRSASEAEAMVTRLWQAEARGPDAVAAVQRELQVVLDQADALSEAERAIVARNLEIATGLSGIVDAGHAAFDPAQLDPYLAQLQALGLITEQKAAALRQLADDAHVDWRAMEESATQYGVAMKTVLDENGNEVQVFDESLLGLGHAQAKLTDEAGQLASAWALLTGEGTHTQVAIEGMTDEAQGFVTKALEMGIALPEAMRPMLDAMVSQGRLTDANGEKLTDLSGLTFAAPIAEGFDLLADKIQLLIITLGGPSGLSQAVEDMAASASLDIKGLAGEWAGMTDAMKTEFGSFAAFVEERALRELAADAGLNYDAIAERWKGMTDAQKAEFGTFLEFMKNEELKQLATDAGLTFDDLEQRWTDMTDAQRTEAESFRAFVNRELDKIKDKTVTVTTQYRTEGAPSGEASGEGVSARHGTPFRHFGRGTPALLHGLERVMTAGEGRGIQAALGRIQQGLGAIATLSGVRALAEGGLVTRPTLATFAEHGPEVAIPLERLEEFGGGRRVESKLDQLNQNLLLLRDELRQGLDPRRTARALVEAVATS